MSGVSEPPLVTMALGVGEPPLPTMAPVFNNSMDALDEGDYYNGFFENDPVIWNCSYLLGPHEEGIPTFKFIVYGILVTVIGFLGICGNIISLIVLTRPKMRASSINCCLIGLTIFDLIVLTTSVMMFGLMTLGEYFNNRTMLNFLDSLIPLFIYPVALTAQTGSVYLTVTVTLERYVAVCLPLRARSLITYGRAKIYVSCVALFAVIYNLPRYFETHLIDCIEDNTDELRKILFPTELRNEPLYKEVYITWFYLLFMYLIPFLSLIVFNIFIYREVRTANHQRNQMSRVQKKEIGLAMMLMVVVIIFFICNLLAFVINILELIEFVVDELTQFSNLLVTINSSVNFIIYCIFGQKFRKYFLKLFCSARCCPGAESRRTLQSVYNNSVYGDRSFTNGRTQTVRLSSFTGTNIQRANSTMEKLPGNQYTCTPLLDTSRTTSFTPSRSPSLGEPQNKSALQGMKPL
ncbi:unnamed protein product, partial [Meganyctiphanes norvegica]